MSGFGYGLALRVKVEPMLGVKDLGSRAGFAGLGFEVFDTFSGFPKNPLRNS